MKTYFKKKTMACSVVFLMQDFHHCWHCQAYEMVKTVFHVSSAVGNYIVLVVCYVILLVTKVHLLLAYPKFLISTIVTMEPL
jgi:hypothetical protein